LKHLDTKAFSDGIRDVEIEFRKGEEVGESKVEMEEDGCRTIGNLSSRGEDRCECK
jgi:hypothetical protein